MFMNLICVKCSWKTEIFINPPPIAIDLIKKVGHSNMKLQLVSDRKSFCLIKLVLNIKRESPAKYLFQENCHCKNSVERIIYNWGLPLTLAVYFSLSHKSGKLGEGLGVLRWAPPHPNPFSFLSIPPIFWSYLLE